METKRNKWTREELILTFNLYCKIEFSKINYRHPLIISLSEIIERTPSAVSWKLVNFASLDSELSKRGIKGAINCSKLDREIFQEFTNNWNKSVEESEILLEKKNKKGKDILRTVKTRTNQSFFRKSVLSSYDNTCCITGINIPELLVASHIIPWAESEENRLNPKNGLCLNNLHDKAFDRGYITFDSDFKLILSSKILKTKGMYIEKYFKSVEGQTLVTPKKFIPDIQFLQYHNEKIFLQ
ncbi:MAG: HNH endonuclease [Epsilonproteobacteria bacterium]|nr:MAG: HNH endonuclease [Campylobacterota bacterium]